MTTTKHLSKHTLPEDVAQAIIEMKAQWRASIGDVPALMAQIVSALEKDIQDIEATQKRAKVLGLKPPITILLMEWFHQRPWR